MRKTNWALIGFFGLMAGLIIMGIVDALEPAFCKPGKLQLAAKQQDVVVFRCWEFWLNRYQGLLGNLVTAGVAGATLLWVARQLTAANRQAAVAAAQGLRAVADELEDESKRLREFNGKLMGASYPFLRQFSRDQNQEYTNYMKISNDSYAAALEETADAMRHTWRRGYGDTHLAESRYLLLEGVESAEKNPARLRSELDEIIRQYVVDRRPVEVIRLIELITKEIDDLRSQVCDFSIEIDEEIIAIWDRIRIFEGSAVGRKSS